MLKSCCILGIASTKTKASLEEGPFKKQKGVIRIDVESGISCSSAIVLAIEHYKAITVKEPNCYRAYLAAWKNKNTKNGVKLIKATRDLHVLAGNYNLIHQLK